MKHLIPVLLILSIFLILIGDQIKKNSSSKSDEKSLDQKSSSSPLPDGKHKHDQHTDDHSDPEKNRRMGIFHFNEGNKSLRKGSFEEAIKNYEMALHHNPEFQETFINLSTTYLKATEYDKALNTLKSLEKINPDHPLLHYNLACYYSLTNRTKESLNALKKSVQLGFKNYEELGRDPDLEHLRKDSAFQKWFKTIQTENGK